MKKIAGRDIVQQKAMSPLFQPNELTSARSMKKAVGISVGTLVVLSGVFASYQLYETRHLSSDLKRTLTAATDEHATEADLRSYFHDARLQVHTKKDEEILQKFEKAE